MKEMAAYQNITRQHATGSLGECCSAVKKSEQKAWALQFMAKKSRCVFFKTAQYS